MSISIGKNPILIVGLLVLTAALAPASAESATDCLKALRIDEPREYECEFKAEDGSPLDGSLEFEMLDEATFTAVFVPDGEAGEGTLAYCSCRSQARFQAAQFGRGKSFVCVNPLGENSASVLIGTPNGNGRKIKKGEAWTADVGDATDFDRMRFKCEAEKKSKKKDKDDD